jgi:hypothetical protein
MQCPDCQYENPTGVTHCEECGLSLYDGLMDLVETKQLNRFLAADLESDIPTSSQPLLLYLPNARKPVAIDRRPNQVIGRKDPETKQSIDIDLSDYDAQALGVSRQHARLNAQELPPIIVDLTSYNGTFVNGIQLKPDEPCELASGDEIRLGRLVTHLYYK